MFIIPFSLIILEARKPASKYSSKYLPYLPKVTLPSPIVQKSPSTKPPEIKLPFAA
jgi:hypothetical protein